MLELLLPTKPKPSQLTAVPHVLQYMDQNINVSGLILTLMIFKHFLDVFSILII